MQQLGCDECCCLFFGEHEIEHVELKGKEFISMDDYIDIHNDSGKSATLEEIEEIFNKAFAAQAANIKLHSDKTLEEMRSSLSSKGGWHDGE